MSRAADRELRAALPMRAGTAPIEDVATVFRFGGGEQVEEERAQARGSERSGQRLVPGTLFTR